MLVKENGILGSSYTLQKLIFCKDNIYDMFKISIY